MKIVDLLRQEPVRVYIYGLLAAVIALLVFYGVVSAAVVPLITGVVLAALALPSPVEIVRSKVSPVSETDRKET